jgi:hypothetical protein
MLGGRGEPCGQCENENKNNCDPAEFRSSPQDFGLVYRWSVGCTSQAENTSWRFGSSLAARRVSATHDGVRTRDRTWQGKRRREWNPGTALSFCLARFPGQDKQFLDSSARKDSQCGHTRGNPMKHYSGQSPLWIERNKQTRERDGRPANANPRVGSRCSAKGKVQV